jgi:NAD(P)H-quinone oxidoreductase subunit 5
MTPLLALLVLVPAAAAALLAWLRMDDPTLARWSVRAAVLTAALSVVLLAGVLVDGPIAVTLPGELSPVGLVADRLGAVLALGVAAIGAVVQAFAARAMGADPGLRRFVVGAHAVTAASLVVVLASGLWLLVAGWFATSVAVSALVAHRRDAHARAAARAVRRRLLVGDAAALAAVVVVTAAVGAVALPLDAAALAELRAASVPLPGTAVVPVLPVVAVLLVVAGASRSALVPFHRWVPATLAAPTPVSALLHAGVVGGAAILVLRTGAIVTSSSVAMASLFGLGVATAVVASGVAVVRTDVKGSLAWSTAAQMGFLVVQVAIGAFGAAVFHLLGHGLYKAAAFLGAGGTTSAVRGARHAPRPSVTFTPAGRRTSSGTIAVLAVVGAALLLRPELGAAKALLVAVVAGAAVTALVDGWLRTAPLGRAGSLAVAVPVALVGATGYLAAVTGLDRLLQPSLPDAAGAVGVVPLAIVLGVVAGLLLAGRLRVGAAATPLRVRATSWLVGHGTARSTVAAGVVASVAGRRAAPTPLRPRARRRTATTTDVEVPA